MRFCHVALAPIHIQLCPEYNVEEERECEPCRDEGVAYFSCGCEESREAACNLCDDCDGRELSCRLRAGVLAYLGKLREEGEWESGHLEEGKCLRGYYVEGKGSCDSSDEGHRDFLGFIV